MAAKASKVTRKTPATPATSWKILPAPKDKVVWMFLPCVLFKTDSDGRPQEVGHEVVLAEFSPEHEHWLQYQRQPVRKLYPSMWAEVINPNVVPEHPELA